MHQHLKRAAGVLAVLTAFLPGVLHAQKDVTQPGDPIIASSSNSPGSEGVANAIDGQPTKYLNFDSRQGGSPSGFVVTPSIGVTRVVGISMQSANDAPERDPKIVTLEGSNDDTVTDFASGNWELIVRLDNVPAYTARFETQTFLFENFKPYKHYRWTVVETQTINTCCMQIAEVELLGSALPPDVTQPGDPLIASSSNSPGSEGVANAIDGQPTKYLNFDSRQGGSPSGFVVTPGIGRSLVTGLTMQSANDAPERDPKIVTLEGSNDDTVTDFGSGNWELIVRLDNVPAYTARFQTQTFLFDNYKPYKHYRWTVVETQTINTCCMQIAEVELLGTGAPKDATQPGDALIASSSNSPGSEGVANAIDGQPTKYLNFDTRTGGSPSGFIVTPSIGATTVIGLTMQSANDAPERDPKIVTLEGSNDDTVSAWTGGNWELIVRLDNVPAYTARFQTQEFYFPNQKAYKHYRWTVLETQTINGCCMQIAEVELLAVSEGADCTKARFLEQPVNTPVLSGSQATFNVLVNGPWPLQWYRNGTAIPGANQASYTTAAVTAQNAEDTYSVEIVGCEMSSTVKAVIFTPSATKSLGITFRGGGANGAPTLMNEDDIAGVWPQAYWMNAANAGAGSLPDYLVDPPVEVVDSDNSVSAIMIDWATSGTWGSGTGNGTATQRLLNGMNLDNPGGDPSTVTFSNVPEGAHAVLVYVVSPPLQFQNVTYRVTGTTTQTYYVRAMNSDEYNAAPGFYRGASTDANNPTIANFVRFDNVRPDFGVITVSVDCTTSGYDRGTGINAVQLVLNAPNPGDPPAIAADPQPTVVAEGDTAMLSVTATGNLLTYQWRKDGRNLPNGGNISGATTPNLVITSFTPEDEGVYSVAVFNPAGSVISKNAAIRLTTYEIKHDLVGNWRLDETGGNTAANQVTGGQPGQVKGTASWGAGQIANAFNFDGSTYLFVEDYPKAETTLSVSAWVKVDPGVSAPVAFIRNGEGTFRRPTSGNPTPTGQFELGLVQNTADNTFLLDAGMMVGPNIPRATATTAFPLGSWQHVALTADGAQLRVYRNGAEVAQIDYLGDINAPNMKYLSIGAMVNTNDPPEIIPDPTNPNFMLGQMDDIGVWTRVLPASTIKAIYDAGLQKKPLTDVIEEKPVSEVPQFTRMTQNANGSITVEWTGGGTLQAAPAVNGPWTDVPGATSPYTLNPTDPALFGRIRK